MKKLISLKTCVAITSLLVMAAAHSATGSIDKAAYKSGKTRIGAEYKTDKTACGKMTANAKDVCMEEAKGKEKVARAELEAAYTGKSADQNKVVMAKAEAAYAVAKEKCDDQAGNAKDVCVKEAKALEVKAKADAKMNKEIGAAKKDAAQEKREADYKVAAEKCDGMSGDAKASCMTAAKAKFGKS